MPDRSPQSSTGKTELLSDKVPGTEGATEPCCNCQSIHRVREERAYPSGKQLLTFWPLELGGASLYNSCYLLVSHILPGSHRVTELSPL